MSFNFVLFAGLMAKILVKSVFNITGHGIIMVGQVKEGSLLPGMKSKINDYEIQAKSMEANHSILSEAKEGETIGIAIVKVSGPDDPQKPFYAFFSKGKYVDTIRSLKGETIEFL